MSEASEKEDYRARQTDGGQAYRAARHEIGHFNTRAWLALSRLMGEHYPWNETDKIDLLMKVKKGGSNERIIGCGKDKSSGAH